MPFAAAVSEHPVTATAVGETAGQILETLGPNPDLALLFVSRHHAGALEDAARAVRSILEPTCLLGTAAESVLGDGREIENRPGVALWAGVVGPVVPVRLTALHDGTTGWPYDLPFEPSLLVVVADPFSFDADRLLRLVDELRPGLPVVGGNASAAVGPGGNRLALDATVFTSGAVGVLVKAPHVETIVSQGCRPIGDPFVVTRAERSVIYELGGRPAYHRLMEIAGALPDDERATLGHGVLLGAVVDERRDEYGPGDFCVHNVVGADKNVGAIAVAGDIGVGTTVQYHVRDAASADAELRHLLRGRSADGALVFTCNGRGRHLFETPDHDAQVVADALGRAAVAGFFAAGEFGPVGGRNFAHGYTASLALLRDTRP